MPLTSPGNDDDTGENHQPTLRKNTAEPVEQTLKQNTVMAVVEIVAAGRRPDRAAIDQTARRIAQGDGPESRARLDTYSRFMREDGDE